ncbi:MAG: hypothetical protein GY937_29130 [bacterium]|nr:hypothetical protein [bacterium]
MPLRFVLILALALIPIPAAAITLVPVSWTSAGFEQGPLSGPPEIGVFCNPGCGTTAGGYFPIAAPDLSFDLGGLQMSAELVSEVIDNRWTYGIRNISVATNGTPTSWDFELYIDFSASFDVPASLLGFSTIAFVAGPAPTELTTTGSVLGPALLSTGAPHALVSGESLDVFGKFEFWVAEGRFPGTGGSCGRSQTVDLSDCLITIDLFEVVATPEPSPAWLLGLLGAGVAYRKRGRLSSAR